MANPVLIAAPLAILPAAAALWYLLRRYEGYFDDGRVFLSLTFGFFAGLLAIFLELALFPFQDPAFQAQVGAGTAFLMFVIGYALFETACKLVVLGTSRFRGRRDTPYYGAALGLGMGSMMALGYIALNLNRAQAFSAAFNQTLNGTMVPTAQYSPLPFIAMIAVPLGAVFAHGGAGAFVGRYIAKGELWKGWVVGAALQAPALMALALFWPSMGITSESNIIPGIIAVGYGVGLMAIARTKVLDHVVPPEIKDKLRRAQRREARAATRGDEEE